MSEFSQKFTSLFCENFVLNKIIYNFNFTNNYKNISINIKSLSEIFICFVSDGNV